MPAHLPPLLPPAVQFLFSPAPAPAAEDSADADSLTGADDTAVCGASLPACLPCTHSCRACTRLLSTGAHPLPHTNLTPASPRPTTPPSARSWSWRRRMMRAAPRHTPSTAAWPPLWPPMAAQPCPMPTAAPPSARRTARRLPSPPPSPALPRPPRWRGQAATPPAPPTAEPTRLDTYPRSAEIC